MDVAIAGNGVPVGSGEIDFLWSNQGSVPESMEEMSSTAAPPNIYVFANHSWRYDPTIPQWTQLNSSTVNPIDGGAALINGNIYLKSGIDAQLAIINVASGLWSAGPSMPDVRDGTCVAAVGGKLYVIGGRLNQATASAMVEQFDPSTNQWSRLADMPTARAFGACAVVNNIIYVIGGQANGTYLSATEGFDPVANSWTAREAMPTRRTLMAATVLQNKIEIIGGLGLSNPRTLTTVEEFDPSKPDGSLGTHNAWSTKNPISAARYGAAAGTVNNSVYVIGGTNVDTSTSVQTIESGSLLASPAISVPVITLSFDDVSINNTGEADFTIQNVGNALLTLSYSSTDSSQFPWLSLPGSLAAGQTTTARMRFKPGGIGPQSATLTISSNDPTTPVVHVTMSGRGTTAGTLPAGQTFVQTATLPVPGTGTPQYFSISNGKAYVGMSNPPQLGVLDLATGLAGGVVTFTPYPGAASGHPAVLGTRAYVPLSNLGSNAQLAVVDLGANSVLQYIPATPDPYGTAVWNNQVYVQNTACWNNGNPSVVQVLNTSTNAFIATIPVNQVATGIAIDAQTGRGYVSGGSCIASSTASTLPQVLDANSNAVTGTINAPFGSQAVTIAGARAYILESGLLDVVDISSNSVLARIPVDPNASRIAATPSFAFVLSDVANAIYVVSAATNSVVATLSVQDPRAIEVDPSSNVIYVLAGSARNIVAFRLRQPTFSLSCSASLGAAPGNNASTACNLASQDTYTGNVTLGCIGLPQGTSCSFAPPSVSLASNGSAQSSLTLSVPANIVSGVYSLQATASDSSTTRTADLSLTVSSCIYSGIASQLNYAAGGGAGNVILSATTGCSWTAGSNASWLTITSGSPGSGNGTVNYTVAGNTTSSSRTATLTVAGQTFTLTQAAATTAVAVFRDTFGSIRLSTYASSTLSNSGGVFASDPSAAQDLSGNTFVTARDNFNSIWANVYNTNTSTWSGWRFGGGIIRGVPSISVDTGGTGWIASRDNYNSYWLVSFTTGSGFSAWTPLLGIFSTDPMVTACGDGSIYLIGKDNFNSLWSGHYIPGTGFQGWQFGGGIIKGKPAATCGGDNAVYVVAEDNYNSHWMARVAGNTWTGWFYVREITSETPRIASLGNGSEAVVILDPTGVVWRTTYTEGTGNGWQPWVQVGGVLQDVAAAGVGGQLYFAGKAPSGDLWWWRQTGNQWTWIGNNGVAAGALSATPR